MKTLIALCVFAGLAFGQGQDGAVEIARSVEPVVDAALDKFTTCVVTLVKDAGASFEKAQASCKDVQQRATRAAEGMMNSSQKAAQASRPVVVAPAVGWGAGGGGIVFRNTGVTGCNNVGCNFVY